MPRNSNIIQAKRVFLQSIFDTDSENQKIGVLLEVSKEFNLSIKAFETLRRQLID